jgi:chromosome partitioning protein
MKTVAVYNMKGGVGKTTTAVNLSYLAAASGQRTLLWDLDPQAASSFALRVQPRVEGFNKRSLEDGEALAAAIKETDYQNLDLLPADFAYRKIERFLGSLGKPESLFGSLLDTLGRDFDLVFLDCPAGFSLLTEGVFTAADAMLVPTIPSVLSLRMVARLIKWASRSGARVRLAAFFSLVDRRKLLHRRASQWLMEDPELFLSGYIPYASVVEQMAVRRLPLAEFAPRDSATAAFAAIWAELQTRLDRDVARPAEQPEWLRMLHVVESLIADLEPVEREEAQANTFGPTTHTEERGGWTHFGRNLAAAGSPPAEADVSFLHRFDTDRRDLEKSGRVLELHERNGSFFVVASVLEGDRRADGSARTEVQIDKAWAVQILAGSMSPLTALERRLGRPEPHVVEEIRWIAAGRKLRRVDTRVERPQERLPQAFQIPFSSHSARRL